MGVLVYTQIYMKLDSVKGAADPLYHIRNNCSLIIFFYVELINI